MPDLLTIEDLEIWTRIGVPKEERAKKQRLSMSLWIQVDMKKTAENDDLKLAIDYEALVKDIKELAEEERKTIEKLAEDTAQMVLKKYKPIKIDLEVKKFVLPDAKYVSVSVTRP